MAVKPIPEGYHSVTPYLVVDNASALLEFVKEAFGAQLRFSMTAPGGKIGHAEFQIGDSIIMTADATTSDQGTAMPGMIHLYVDEVDKTYQRALESGATSLREPADQFYGDRSSGVKDANGNQWWISTHVEDVSPEEMAKRVEEFEAKQPT
jgi:uncharacterized glyoxalase superfamily protein PhnB